MSFSFRPIIKIIITEQCNLSCPHCGVQKYTNDNYNEEKFINVLKEFDNIEKYNYSLFGGEPLLYPERIENIFDNTNINPNRCSLSTNLTILDDRRLELLKFLGGLGTSWDINRFNNDQYQLWLNNIDICLNNNISIDVGITLTEDLFEYGSDNLSKLISTWNNGINSIKFINMVTDNRSSNYYQKADEFMCEMLDKWNSKINFWNKDIIHNFLIGCQSVKSIYPDGRIINKCTMEAATNNRKRHLVKKECIKCEHVNICYPCPLLDGCPYPHNFAHKINFNKYSGM